MKQILKNKIKQSIYFLILLFFMLGCSSSIQQHPDVSQHPTAKEIVELVDDAAALVEENGTAAFDDFRELDSKWRYDDVYIYVFNMDNVNLFHPIENLDGADFATIPDEKTYEIVKNLTEVVKENESGWISYLWIAPNDTEETLKYSYAKAVIINGEAAFIGSGFHPKNY